MATGQKKSPRAPSISLEDALERAGRAYDKERLHAAPIDVMAEHIGYKTANSGAALQALASLRYYGLFERPQEGQLAVSKDVEAFRYAPDESVQRALLVKFLRTPPLFSELLDKYSGALPSDGNLKYELIQRGFLPGTAFVVVNAFKRSVAFASYFDAPAVTPSSDIVEPGKTQHVGDERASERFVQSIATPIEPSPVHSQDEDSLDRIPVRLTGGRRAWLLIPAVFLEADKQRLKAQIDLLLTEEDDG